MSKRIGASIILALMVVIILLLVYVVNLQRHCDFLYDHVMDAYERIGWTGNQTDEVMY